MTTVPFVRRKSKWIVIVQQKPQKIDFLTVKQLRGMDLIYHGQRSTLNQLIICSTLTTMLPGIWASKFHTRTCSANTESGPNYVQYTYFLGGTFSCACFFQVSLWCIYIYKIIHTLDRYMIYVLHIFCIIFARSWNPTFWHFFQWCCHPQHWQTCDIDKLRHTAQSRTYQVWDPSSSRLDRDRKFNIISPLKNGAWKTGLSY